MVKLANMFLNFFKTNHLERKKQKQPLNLLGLPSVLLPKTTKEKTKFYELQCEE